MERRQSVILASSSLRGLILHSLTFRRPRASPRASMTDIRKINDCFAVYIAYKVEDTSSSYPDLSLNMQMSAQNSPVVSIIPMVPHVLRFARFQSIAACSNAKGCGGD